MSKKPPTSARPPGLKGLVCFEGSWGERLDSKESIEPALRCIESLGFADVIHKDVATSEELEHYVNQWLGLRGRALPLYRMGMFAFHGSRDMIALGKDDISLSDLAGMIAGRAANRVIYFGGCDVLNQSDEALQRFCRSTGAIGMVGYTRKVEFLDSVAFEIMLIRETLYASSFKPVFTRLRKEHPEWTRRLGLRMAHKSWVSPRL